MTALTVHKLIAEYRKDPASPYHDVVFATRQNYDSLLRRLDEEKGSVTIASLKVQEVKAWYREWAARGITQAHSLMAMLRIIARFGVSFLEDDECARLTAVLSGQKFKQGKPREVFLTATQADLIRAEARRIGFPSIALAQALQFEGTLRQKDIIGQWVPVSEPGMSEITSRKHGKWISGARWSEIDADLIFRHITTKTGAPVEIDLKLAPMVLEDPGCIVGGVPHRALLPASGPLIVNEETKRPYLAHQFRRAWRALARSVGIPDNVQNRDSRAGAITEAIEAGAPIEDAQKAAKHSTPQMTARYWRGDAKATSRTMKKRGAHRQRAAGDEDVA
jgi:hypothetical protein